MNKDGDGFAIDSEGDGLGVHMVIQTELDLESDEPIDLCPLNPNGDTICEACQ